MPSAPEYALMAASAYAAKPNVTSDQNEIPAPAGWTWLNIDAINDSTGFTARAYKSNTSNEIVIAYTGTTKEPDGASDWTNGNIPGATGWSLANQLLGAAKFYLDVRKANDGATIRLTGHSLGGADLLRRRQQGRGRRPIESDDRLAITRRIPPNEVIGEQRDVIATLAQRRQLQHVRLEPIVQIGT